MTFIAFLGACLLLSSAAYADPAEANRSVGGHGQGMMHMRHKEGGQCQVAGKFTKKAHFILENQKELGLTDQQVTTIKELKLQAERDGIQQNADREIYLLDLRSKLGEDKIDVEGTNALIDKNFLSAAAAEKANVQAYAKLKSTLTPEQITKMKELLKSKKELWENKGK